MAKNLLGLDIGSHSIKMIQLKGSGKKWSLAKYCIQKISGGSTSELSPDERRDTIINDLKQMVSSSKITLKKVATAVSGNSVIVRYVKFPKMSPQDLQKTIQFEAEPYIPFDVKEVNIGTQILGDVTEEGVAKMETVLVAAKNDILQERMNTIANAGLKTAIIDVDAFTLENSYELVRDPSMPETVMLLNIGASVTNINILENGISKVVRDIFIAGETFTNAIQRGLQVDYKTAEELKENKGLIVSAEQGEAAEEDVRISMAMVPVVHELVAEIKRSIDYYQAPTEGEMRVERVLLSGGSANLKHIDRFLASELNIPVEINNPFQNINTGGAKSGWEEIAPVLAVAAGLAMRREGDSR